MAPEQRPYQFTTATVAVLAVLALAGTIVACGLLMVLYILMCTPCRATHKHPPHWPSLNSQPVQKHIVQHQSLAHQQAAPDLMLQQCSMHMVEPAQFLEVGTPRSPGCLRVIKYDRAAAWHCTSCAFFLHVLQFQLQPCLPVHLG